MKITGDLKSQKNGRIVPPVFKRTDSLSGHLQSGRQFFLLNAVQFSDFLQFIFQMITSLQKRKVNFPYQQYHIQRKMSSWLSQIKINHNFYLDLGIIYEN